MLLRSREVERSDQHPRLLGPKFRKNVAALVADEAMPVEALAALRANAVGGDDRHHVRDCMADHRATP